MKQIFSVLLAALTLISAAAFAPAQANASEPIDTAVVYSSDYLSSYNVFATKVGSGKMDITFEVYGTQTMSKIGVSSIEIYKDLNTKVATIYGSTSNGLQASNIFAHLGTYHFTGTSGTAYYAKVTIFASNGSGSDSRTVITNSITL